MKSKGFTLVEITIVMIIIGLMVGGVIVARTMIRSSEISSIIADKEKYQTALNAFVEKYKSLPGDMPNATTYWTAADPTPATCVTTVGTGTQTCNGDGNGTIMTLGTATTYYEMPRAWQHLANAGLISGSYSGVMGAGGALHMVPAVNAPRSKIGNAGFSVYTCLGCGNTYAASEYWVAAEDALVMDFGAVSSNNRTYLPVISGIEALTMETKIDDGKPAYGMVLSYKAGSANAPSCATTNVDTTAAYTTNENITCSLLFKTGM